MNIENQIIIGKYDTNIFPFAEIFAEHCSETLNCSEHYKLHEYIADNLKPNKILRVGEDQATYAHSVLYKIDPRYQKDPEIKSKVKDRAFIKTYERFIGFLEASVFFEKLVYQKLPTLRIHLPNNLSVGEYHRDRDYNHPIEEINIWVPVTKAKGSATIQMESSYDAGDFHPIEVEYGEYLIFDSGLKHGNEVNIEGYTRISFDFRVIPISNYKVSDLSSINQKMKFAVGDYYSY
ncbi:hypothetical protein [Nostoc favosum]|uniref:2OG-Fe(II) oxygenase n=1 Tax=Nostoc favosum CHAB5714 TaxID=2780399 RepID=A0ABS8IHL8_9NOSO|nr:hypothetical protein [Nostoc favosum]MCC5603684.1 hypothetical protein [Nostoc favosum CHAB5714]